MNAPDRIELPLGLVYGMDSVDYHAIEALGASGLKLLRRSPAHYYGQMLDPERPPREATPAMKSGTLAHCAVLEPHALAERYVVRPDGLDGRTKEGKAWLATVQPGVEAVTAEQMRTAQRQAAAVRALPEIGPLLESGRSEVSVFWNDDTTGAPCKARPDWVHETPSGVILLDLKTASEADAIGFARAVARYDYAMQAQHYCAGFVAATGVPVLGFCFVAVESDFPHAAAAYVLADEWLTKAAELRSSLLRSYADCKASGLWPGYPSSIQQLEAPTWI